MKNTPTKQEQYDRTMRHLREQGGPARNDHDKCMLLAPDGRQCAAGYWVLDDALAEQWDEHSSSVSIGSLPRKWNDLTIHLHDQGLDLDLMGSVQDLHDNASLAFGGRWNAGFETEAKRVAHQHGLIYTAPAA